MTERTYKQLAAVIGKFMVKWKSNLFLGMWKVDWNLRDNLISEIQDFQVIGRCVSDYTRFNAELNFSHLMMKEMTEAEIEETVIHELLHAVVNEMREDGHEHEERVVSHLTLIAKQMNGKAKNGKD